MSRDQTTECGDSGGDETLTKGFSPIMHAQVARSAPLIESDELRLPRHIVIARADVADDLLHDVFNSHDPGRSSKLVDDDRKLRLRRTSFAADRCCRATRTWWTAWAPTAARFSVKVHSWESPCFGTVKSVLLKSLKRTRSPHGK